MYSCLFYITHLWKISLGKAGVVQTQNVQKYKLSQKYFSGILLKRLWKTFAENLLMAASTQRLSPHRTSTDSYGCFHALVFLKWRDKIWSSTKMHWHPLVQDLVERFVTHQSRPANPWMDHLLQLKLLLDLQERSLPALRKQFTIVSMDTEFKQKPAFGFHLRSKMPTELCFSLNFWWSFEPYSYDT